MKKLIFSTLIILLGFSSTVFSQYRHEFSIGAGGGLSSISYSPSIGESKSGFGGHLALGYHYFFSPNLGVLTGLDVGLYGGKFTLPNSFNQHTFGATDYQGTAFTFNSSISNFEETQTAMLLQIPIMLQYQSNGLLYAAGGLKLGLPLSASWKSSGSYTTTGFYPVEGYEYNDHLFGSASRDFDGDLDLKLAVMLALEAGVKLDLSEGKKLYIGAFLDYGVTDFSNPPSSLPRFVDYNNSATSFANSLVGGGSAVQSGYGNSRTAIADKLSPLAVGLKVRFSFGRGSAEKVVTETTPTPQPRQEAERVDAEEEARRREAEEEARRRAAEEEAARRAAEEEARRVAAEEQARRDAIARARASIERPTDSYNVSVSRLDDRQRRELDEKIAVLQQNPDIRIIINGHTCDIGSLTVNQRIGMQRAEAAKAYLISKGIAANRIVTLNTRWYLEPLVPNNSEANRKLNRRVQFLIAD